MWIKVRTGYYNLDKAERAQLTGKYIRVYREADTEIAAEAEYASESESEKAFLELGRKMSVPGLPKQTIGGI